MQVYLVVIDSTSSPRNVNESTNDGMNVRNFSLAKGIQNFYFIMAPNADSAKNMVLNTFRAKPAVQRDVARCITATPLKAITKLLSERQNTWSYIPIGGVRAPGQQGVNNTLQKIEELNRMGQESEVSHRDWQPPRPVTYDNQVVTDTDLRNVRADPEDMKVLQSGSQPQATGDMDINQMKVMMAQMQKMMESMTGGQNISVIDPNTLQPNIDFRKADPQSDPDLLARIQANMKGSPEIVEDDDVEGTSDPGWGDDEDLKSVE